MTVFKEQHSIGRSRYTIAYHDGIKKHRDGSEFFDLKIFSNKVELQKFKNELLSKNYDHI